jgi:hypothetical protein
VEMPLDYQVPLKGDVDNLYIIAKGNFTEDTWAEAAEVRPSNRQVVHHMRVWIRPPGSHWLDGVPYGTPVPLGTALAQFRQQPRQNAEIDNTQEIIAKYNPGLEPQHFAIDGAAKLIPKGSDIVFEAHYIAIGKPATDRSRIGIVLAKGAPERRYATVSGLNALFEIAPGDSNKEVRAQTVVQYDTKLAWLQPHMHLRGKDYQLTAFYPSGESEILLKTDFNFDWQLGYLFSKPVVLPKGTRLVAVSHFDNSANNRLNPDPTATVKWGLQSWNEMSLIYFGLIVDRHADPEKVFGNSPRVLE